MNLALDPGSLAPWSTTYTLYHTIFKYEALREYERERNVCRVTEKGKDRKGHKIWNLNTLTATSIISVPCS